MKRLVALLSILLCASASYGQGTTTQNARRLRSGTAVPTIACVPGPPFTDVYVRTTDHSEYQCTAAPNTWTKVVSGGTPGDVVGPASATDNHLAVFDGATGKLIKDGGAIPSATPAGSNTQLQYNNSGVFAGSSGGTASATKVTLVAPVLGTPDSVTLTNGTGLPVSTGVSGLGTGISTALGVNVGTAGAPVVNGGALGSPSSAGTIPAFTLGGTISAGGNQLNNVIIGTTTPLAGTFTTGVFGSTTSLLLGTAGSAVGNIGFRNAISGTATIAPPSGALGTYNVTLPNAASTLPIYGQQITYAGPSAARTVTYPDANFTIARVDAANTFTGASSTTSWAETTPVITGGLTASGSGANTFAGSSGTFLTSTGAVTIGPGAVGVSGIATFTPPVRSSGVASYFTLTPPADTGQTTATESIGANFATATRTWVDGTVALQRERFFAGPTYNKTTTSATFTDVFNSYFTPPVAGSGVTFTRGHTLGIVDSTSASSSITGGLVVATTLGTAATSVGIGGGSVFAGSSVSAGTNPSATGAFRLANNDVVSFRNSANSGDQVALRVTSSNNVALGDLWTINTATGSWGAAGSYPIVWTSGSPDTGIGKSSAGVVEITNGTSGTFRDLLARAGTFSGAFINSGITADTAHTDSSVCQDTTTHQFYSGTGTLGVCLGTSSARYKNSIQGFKTGGLNQVLALRPKQFFYNAGYGDNGARLQYGFLAEDVVKVIPELVGLDAKDRPNSVDILGMIPKAIVPGMQELNAKFESMAVRVTALEKENKRLRAQLRHRRR